MQYYDSISRSFQSNSNEKVNKAINLTSLVRNCVENAKAKYNCKIDFAYYDIPLFASCKDRDVLLDTVEAFMLFCQKFTEFSVKLCVVAEEFSINLEFTTNNPDDKLTMKFAMCTGIPNIVISDSANDFSEIVMKNTVSTLFDTLDVLYSESQNK